MAHVTVMSTGDFQIRFNALSLSFSETESGKGPLGLSDFSLFDYITILLGRRQANLCFHFAGSGENLPDIAKSRGASMHNKI